MDLESMNLSERILLFCDTLQRDFSLKYGCKKSNILLEGDLKEMYDSIVDSRVKPNRSLLERVFRRIHAMYPASYRRMILFGFYQYVYGFVGEYWNNHTMYWNIHRQGLLDQGYGEHSWELHSTMLNYSETMLDGRAWGDVAASIDRFFTDSDLTPSEDIEMNAYYVELLDDFEIDDTPFPHIWKDVDFPYCTIPPPKSYPTSVRTVPYDDWVRERQKVLNN